MTKNLNAISSRLVFVLVMVIAPLLTVAPAAHGQQPPVTLPIPSEVQDVARRVNDYWIANRPGPEDNNWSRSTYFTGNMAHYQMTGDTRYLDHVWQWAEQFNWQLNGGCNTVFAENLTAAQIYLALYEIDPQRADLECLLTNIETSMSWGWLEVDLGAVTHINRIVLDTFQDRAYRYVVDVKESADAPYVMALDRLDGQQGESTIASTPARFVRLRVTGADGYDGLRVSLDEFQLFGEAMPNTNLALNHPVICSSEPEPQNSCANVVDGDPGTAWSAIIPDDFTIGSPKWWWVDALYVAMPVYAQLSNLEHDGTLPEKLGYSSALFAKYDETKQQRGLWDAEEGMWYRDLRFVNMPSPNGEKIFWSRGNGWAFAALARVLEILPTTDPHYQEYLATFQQMAAALIEKQDQAGFWHQNLADPDHCGGPESSGTAFFTYGLAWGINHQHLDRATYLPATIRAWEWLTETAVQDDPAGLLGYVQPVGDAPICTQEQPLPGPTTTEDFGVGLFLLAASEVVKLESSHVFDWAIYLPLMTR